MCIRSSCTIVYNLALDRGRLSLQREIELPYEKEDFSVLFSIYYSLLSVFHFFIT